VPLLAILLDNVPEVRKYKVTENGVNGIWLLPQGGAKLLMVVIRPVLYVFEWSWANPLYRFMIKRGLKKQGYQITNDSFIKINRMEIVQRLIDMQVKLKV
jgi:hypothetical protein